MLLACSTAFLSMLPQAGVAGVQLKNFLGVMSTTQVHAIGVQCHEGRPGEGSGLHVPVACRMQVLGT